jgi:16S rRNA pseudouridine516 synthase
MRLDKFICKSTLLTKIESVHCIHSGDITVNGNVVFDESVQVHENNDVCLSGNKLIARNFRYILMHKPSGTICSNIDEVYPSLFHYLNVDRASELHIAGRLDADTTGMVLITDDGRWSFHITTPTNKCSKVYRVSLSRDIADDVAEKFKLGVKLQGEVGLTAPAILTIISSKEVLLTITEGKFHQVKRMFSAVGNRVISLHREAIGGVRLDVNVGEWRYLTADEIESLKP